MRSWLRHKFQGTKVPRVETFTANLEDRTFADLVLAGETVQDASRQVYGDPVTGKAKLVTKPVQEYTQRIRDKSESKSVASVREIKEFWTEVMRGKRKVVIDGVVQEIPIPIADSLKASALLAKNKGLLNDKVEVTHRVRLSGDELRQQIAEKMARLKEAGVRVPALIEDGRVVSG